MSLGLESRKQQSTLEQCTELSSTSFLSDQFITVAIGKTRQKLVNPTSVQW